MYCRSGVGSEEHLGRFPGIELLLLPLPSLDRNVTALSAIVGLQSAQSMRTLQPKFADRRANLPDQ